MNPILLHALNQLVQETRAFLAHADPDLARWETYMSRRAEIFAWLQPLDLTAAELADPAVGALKDEIFQQEPAIQEKAHAQLERLGVEIRMLATGRRALHGYASPSPVVLFERSV